MSKEVFDTTVVIPAHWARITNGLLGRALGSVFAQTVQPRAISLAVDHLGDGAAKTRQRALDAVGDTEFVSFLDSDDLWYPNHLETHRRLLTEGAGGDVAYSWFDGNGIAQQWEATHRGRVWDPAAPHHTTMTVTVRTSFARRASFPIAPLHEDWTGEDWSYLLQLNELGARFVGSGDVTFNYTVHGGNTSGSPMRGDALQ